MTLHIRLQLSILLVLGLAWCADEARASGVVTFMTVQNGDLIYCDPSSGCPNPSNGNITVAKNQKPDLSWVLTGAAGWTFTKIEFNTVPDGSGTWTAPGDPALPACTELALPGPATITSGGRHLKIADNNQAVCATAYRICAEDNSGSEDCAHPVITNEGTDATRLPATELEYLIELLEQQLSTSTAE